MLLEQTGLNSCASNTHYSMVIDQSSRGLQIYRCNLFDHKPLTNGTAAFISTATHIAYGKQASSARDPVPGSGQLSPDAHKFLTPANSSHSFLLAAFICTCCRDSALNPNVDALLTRASGFHTTLRAALEDPEWMAEGGAIGFKCRCGTIVTVIIVLVTSLAQRGGSTTRYCTFLNGHEGKSLLITEGVVTHGYLPAVVLCGTLY